MSIQWNYLNKHTATENALRDYRSMQYILAGTDEKIKNIHEDMAAVHSPSWSDMPKIHNNNAHEEKIMNGIEEIDILRERYRNAKEYMAWIQPALEQLSEDERFVLNEFYMADPEGQEVAKYTVARKYNINCANGAYRKKNRALDHLTILLYGTN